MNHRELWKKVFDDTDKYIEFYFREKAKRSIVYSQYEEGDLASMAFFTPCRMMYCGQECTCPYIVGVATRPESRHRGYMTMLLEQGIMDAQLSGTRFVFLSPADEKIYEPLGFQGVFYRKSIEVGDISRERNEKWYSVSSFARLEGEMKKKAAEFASAQLYMSDIDLYMYRDTGYYELLCKEVKALGGAVIVLREEEMIKAVAAYIHEDDSYEITEVICAPEDGQKVFESICAYIGDSEKIVFSDGYFLGDVSGPGVRIRQMKKPYIMIKGLDEEEDITGLDVYINDIT